MKYPKLTELPRTREAIEVFAGYNAGVRIGEGEFRHMQNLTSDHYPVLSPRERRGTYGAVSSPQGLIAKDALCYVDGSAFYINGYPVAGLVLSTLDSDCPKTLISMGAYVIIMPDKKYVNTEKLTDYGNIEAEVVTSEAVTFSMCRVDGEEYGEILMQDAEPTSPSNLDYWIDTSSTPHTLKQYSEASEMWVSIATTYIKITSAGIGAPFAEYDGVTISGVEEIADLNNTMIVYARGDDYIVVAGMLDEVTTQSAPVTVARRMPAMDFITESGNRLWGCRYGYANDGETFVNEIYASKLGDFKNWSCYMGISTDSYATTVGTDGQFTGAVTHLGYPLFFKEGYLHKVYGNYPSNYQIQTTACRGVQKGSHRSLAIVNEVLYYKARQAVCAYDGSLPEEISAALGDTYYTAAVGGAHRNKYYVSMKDRSGASHLFVFDTQKGLWHREDDVCVETFCSVDNELYFIANGKIVTEFGSGTEDSRPVRWSAETGDLAISMPYKKYISSLSIRLTAERGTHVRIFLEYDSSGDWEHVYTIPGDKLCSFTIPILPRRCDHLRLRLEGIGPAKVFGIYKTVEKGSDG